MWPSHLLLDRAYRMQSTEDNTCLKKFFSLHGLRLIWSWMVELADESSEDVLDTRVEVSRCGLIGCGSWQLGSCTASTDFADTETPPHP